MKKFIYIIAMLSLPAFVFSQNQDVAYTTDFKVDGRVLKISPNPGNGQFTILFSNYHDVFTSMIAYDNTGKQIYQKDHLNGNPVRVDLSHFQSGIYFLVFSSDNRQERITERVAIVK